MFQYLAETDFSGTLLNLLMTLGGFTGVVITFILYNMKTALDKNTAVVACLAEIQLVRITQDAKNEHEKQVADILTKHLEESKK